jgi:chromosome partitioning protein
MKVWAIANQKGGVGKTTTTVSLAGWLAERGARTLLIDLDPHGSLTTYFGYNPDSVQRGVYTLFQDKQVPVPEVIEQTRFENLALIPASLALATLDRQLGTQEGMGLVISRALKSVKGQFDYALIDCPPMLGVPMVNALAACQHLVVPVQTEYLALQGLERMLRTINMITRAGKDTLRYTIVPTMFDRRTKASTLSLNLLREQHSGEVSQVTIPVDTRFRDASRAGIPLPLMAPRSRGAIAYGELIEEILAPLPVDQTAVA